MSTDEETVNSIQKQASSQKEEQLSTASVVVTFHAAHMEGPLLILKSHQSSLTLFLGHML